MTHCCKSPLKFQVPNGEGTLSNDERIKVSLPAGTISSEGLQAIVNYLRVFSHSWPVGSDVANGHLGDQWVTDRGTFSKRLRQYAHKKYAIGLGDNVLTEVGNLARTHSNGVDLKVAVTRGLNRSASAFANDESCWWTEDYESSRCAFKTNGGFGLRSFTPEVNGRAWVFPVNDNLKPTFETLKPAGYVVFNGYGDLSDLAGVRVMALLTGMTYTKVAFKVTLDDEEEMMQVNGYSGYLLTPDGKDPGRLEWYLEPHADLRDREFAAA